MRRRESSIRCRRSLATGSGCWGVDNSGAPGQQVVHADAERFLQNTADMPYGIQSSFGKRCRQPAESQRKHNAAAGDGDRRRSRSFATLWTTS
jgi:hypothetical protein